ncbi:MAG: hypothetical protein LBL34_06515 [Clostridiales bacterium]|nr:hypothetical protein [Clostridiales bacterium]
MSRKHIETITGQLSMLNGKQISNAYKDNSSFNLDFVDFSLTIDGFFRFVYKGKIILSSYDMVATEFDDYVKTVFKSLDGYVVKEVKIGKFGDFTLTFKNNAQLEVISDSSYDESVWSLGNCIVTPYEVKTRGDKNA